MLDYIIEKYSFFFIFIFIFILGISIGEQTKVYKTNKIVTVIDNPNCIDGRMK